MCIKIGLAISNLSLYGPNYFSVCCIMICFGFYPIIININDNNSNNSSNNNNNYYNNKNNYNNKKCGRSLDLTFYYGNSSFFWRTIMYMF